MPLRPPFSRAVAVAAALATTVPALRSPGSAQTVAPSASSAAITVSLGQRVGEMYPMWAYFGYDEPNYTYSWEGKKLLTEISELSPVPVYVRAHNMLNTHDGPPSAFKWGSTNAYTEDAAGNPVYNWTLVDSIVDIWVNRGMKPLMEIGFMPKALSTNPEPYGHGWKPGDPYNDIYTGWAYPPKDYAKWSELVYRWVRHSVERYGAQEVESWWWELWNEPDIGYWKGTPEEYLKLYDYTADAVKRALPTARIGGPTVTGGGYRLMTTFLEHARNGTNYVTGKKGTPLDFIGFHAKGSPQFVEGRVRTNMAPELRSVDRFFEMVASYPEFRNVPIIIGEADPEGCAACSVASGSRQNAYRNGTMYSSYTAASFARMYELADQRKVNFEGATSWSFTFENVPWFDGFRELATNGVGKPVLNVFRMFGMMGGDRVAVQGNSTDAREILARGVRGERADISALASRQGDVASVMVWNYHDDDVPAPDAQVELSIRDVPAGRVLVHHYRIDERHSNSYSAWLRMGAPQQVSRTQYAELEAAGKLQLLDAPRWIDAEAGAAQLRFALPRQGVSLVRLSWDQP
ncbi:MAG: beta-xylosidase [Gemmatimonadetes bacterium]|nr:beta-xylosidase [Gemmatimonadota bacterium]